MLIENYFVEKHFGSVFQLLLLQLHLLHIAMNAERRKHVEERINALRVEISKLELELEQLSDTEQERSIPENLPLRMDDYRRYGRQMILPGFGLPGNW